MIFASSIPLAAAAAAAAFVPSPAHANPIDAASDAASHAATHAALALVRALPDSPSGGYAPSHVSCPKNRPTVRLASSLSDEETSWLSKRRPNTVDPLRKWLSRAAIPGFDSDKYIKSVKDNDTALPNLGIAVSGGGYRALMNGAGFLAAADDRTDNSTGEGQIGGLLQASTYLSGLSGGGWLVGSMFANNFSSVTTLRDNDGEKYPVWEFDSSIFMGPDESGWDLLNTASYWKEVHDTVSKKDDDGYAVSLTDYWGRALSYQLVGAPNAGSAYTFSSIAETDDFADGKTPFPILLADGRAPGEKIISLNSTVYEFNAYEFGSWDPTVYGFIPTEYIGSNFTDGEVATDEADTYCVRGFDQIGFVMGTSSSLFNTVLAKNISNFVDVPDFVADAIKAIAAHLDENDNDIAEYDPNPFKGWRGDAEVENPNADADQLTLVDGGEDLQNIPLWPLIQPVRGVDTIFAVDSSADTDVNWPNGTALRASYERSQHSMSNGTLFPSVPDDHTFINKGLNKRPTFFGCDVSNFTLDEGSNQTAPPLIVYIPNAPYITQSNVSTFDPSYPDAQRNDIIENGYNAATQGNGTLDSDWPVCLACAALSRSFHKTGTTVPDSCADCFDKYCWDGSLDTTDHGPYYPDFIIGNQTTVVADSAAGPALAVPGARSLWAMVASAGLAVGVLM